MTDFLSYRETIKLLVEFLEISFHQILYLRQVYPRELFQEKKKYDVMVWQSRNPALNEYLGKVVHAVGEELCKGNLKRVALVVKEADAEETPLERIVWDFEWLIPEGKMPEGGGDWRPKTNGLPRGHIEDHLRGFLLKLSVADTYLSRLPQEVTFAVIIEVHPNAPRPQSDESRKGHVPAEWIPATTRDAFRTAPTAAVGRREDEEMDDVEDEGADEGGEGLSTIAPLKTTRLGIINVQMVVEEMEAKFGVTRTDEEMFSRVKIDVKGKGKAV